jgi:acetyl esterase
MGKLGKEEAALLERMRAAGFKPAHQMPLELVRSMLPQMAQAMSRPGVAVEKVENVTIAGPGGDLKLRIYDPGPGVGAKRGVALFFHGGGFCVGDLDTHDGACRQVSASALVPVVAVDYRLAPEHKFPAGLEDCYAALKWAVSEGTRGRWDNRRIAVMGDSAGGSLAASLCLMARARGGPAIAYQVLIYAGVALDDGEEFPSRSKLGSGEYFLPREDFVFFRETYLRNPEREMSDPLVSPIRAADFGGLPPALILTAEFDPLRDEAARYAELLRTAGVAAEYVCYEGTIHGFFVFDAVLESGCRAQALVAERLKGLLGARP